MSLTTTIIIGVAALAIIAVMVAWAICAMGGMADDRTEEHYRKLLMTRNGWRILCPECESAHILLGRREGHYLCDRCGHEWEPEIAGAGDEGMRKVR